MLGFSLEQHPLPKLRITPELKQYLQILQFSSDELTAYLEEVAAENPLIEIVSPRDPYGKRQSRTSAGIRGDGDVDPIARLPVREDSLEHWVSRQLAGLALSRDMRRAVLFLAGNLNDAGYLEIGLEEAAGMLGLSPEFMERCLAVLQSLDPPGIGARDLRECLRLQIERDPGFPPLAAEIVKHRLEDLARGRYDQIARELGAEKADVEQAACAIRRLNPHPCASLGRFEPVYVVADAQIMIRSVEEWSVGIHDRAVPRIAINPDYSRYAERNSGLSGEEQRYFRKKLRSAKWLIRSVRQRRLTLEKVIHAIAEEQLPYFAGESAEWRPLTLKMISDKIGFHVSTISRAVRGKYIETPRGVFELKQFFSNAFRSGNGTGISARTVKRKIREMIAAEDKSRPLSDQTIARLLQREGIPIARRTVAKYREEEHILPSWLRKKV